MGRSCSIYRRRAAASSGETQYTTFASLSAALLAGSVGDRATLYGASTWIGAWQKTGASSVQLISPLRLWASDGGAEFTSGADGDGDDIETYDGTDAPTWGAAGAATGGIILNGTGSILLPFIGSFDPAALFISARLVFDALTPAHLQEFGAGFFSTARAKAFGSGGQYLTATWYKKLLLMTTAPSLAPSGASAAGYDLETLAAASEIVVSCGWVAADRADGYSSYFAGAYAGDEPATSYSASGAAATTGTFAGATDQEVFLHAEAEAGVMSMRCTEIAVGFMTAPA